MKKTFIASIFLIIVWVQPLMAQRFTAVVTTNATATNTTSEKVIKTAPVPNTSSGRLLAQAREWFQTNSYKPSN
jgi:hypothetical protein